MRQGGGAGGLDSEYDGGHTIYARRKRPPSKRSLRDAETLAEIVRVRTGHAAV